MTQPADSPADLRLIRVSLGLSIPEIADKLAIPRQTWYRWETARTTIQHPRILALALRGLKAELQDGEHIDSGRAHATDL